MRYFLLICFLIASYAVISQAHPDHATYQQVLDSDVLKWFVPRTNQTPLIDGQLDDRCWAGARGAKGFTRVLEQGAGPSTRQTTVYLTYDRDNLYVAFECTEPRLADRMARVRTRDGKVFRDDCIEVYLDVSHDHDSYAQFVVNTLNTQYDAQKPFPANQWDAEWKSAVAIFSEHFQVELAIPFKSLGVTMPEPYEVWGGNFYRQVWVPGAEEWSGWSPTREWFHEPGYFGHLIFAPEPLT